MKKEEIDEAGETPKTSPNHKKSVKKQVDDEKEQKPSTSKDLDSESEPKLTKTSDKSTTKKKEEDSAKEEEHSDVDMEKEEKAEKTHLDFLQYVRRTAEHEANIVRSAGQNVLHFSRWRRSVK
uniref:Uncharacterized protein n=1 Tax=Ditylenchus dipsaci TaxID=166011 RepID=A0A915EJD4_9BILA